jgi:hypothetical protein
MTVAVITSMTAYLYLYSHGLVSHAASQPVSARLILTFEVTSCMLATFSLLG